jgi:hypothetical protein
MRSLTISDEIKEYNVELNIEQAWEDMGVQNCNRKIWSEHTAMDNS